jgi:phage terminase Nu1 subunit (DNA packaging protein)
VSDVAQLPVRMDQPATQAAFGAMVGITQQAVSDLQARGVIAAGQPLGVWLTAYCDHLREMAAGRDPDGQLATERTRLAREQADRLAMRNAVDRKDYAPVQLLEEVLASLARQVATQLDAVLPEVRRRFPYLTGEPIRFLEERLVSAREAAAAARFSAETLEREPDDEEGGS